MTSTRRNIPNWWHAYQIIAAMTKAQVPGRVEPIVGVGRGWFGAEMERTVDGVV